MPLSPWHYAVAAAGIGGSVWWWFSRQLEVAAWSGWTAIADPATAIARAKAKGIDRLSLFVNQRPDGAAFSTYDPAAVIAACAAIRAAGLRVGLVSWMTARPDWIEGAATLGRLATAAGVDELELDLEEEWTAIRGQSDSAIATATDRVFDLLRATYQRRIGVTAIVYHDPRVLSRAFGRADFMVPQAYATALNAATLPTGALEREAAARYRPYSREIVMGVAGWNQPGAYGIARAADVMRVSLAAISELGIRRVRIWRLELLDDYEGAVIGAWKARGDLPARGVA